VDLVPLFKGNKFRIDRKKSFFKGLFLKDENVSVFMGELRFSLFLLKNRGSVCPEWKLSHERWNEG
jgi:hypothetical protein